MFGGYVPIHNWKLSSSGHAPVCSYGYRYNEGRDVGSSFYYSISGLHYAPGLQVWLLLASSLVLSHYR